MPGRQITFSTFWSGSNDNYYQNRFCSMRFWPFHGKAQIDEFNYAARHIISSLRPLVATDHLAWWLSPLTIFNRCWFPNQSHRSRWSCDCSPTVGYCWSREVCSSDWPLSQEAGSVYYSPYCIPGFAALRSLTSGGQMVFCYSMTVHTNVPSSTCETGLKRSRSVVYVYPCTCTFLHFISFYSVHCMISPSIC